MRSQDHASTPAAPASASSRLYERIRADVLGGRFGVTELLLETTLAEEYGISRTPIREALGRLEQDGLLERAARGYRVRSGTFEDVLDIYEARIALESEAAAAAATRRTDLDLARLRHLSAAVTAESDPAEQRQLNAEWHVALWRASHNATIVALLGRLTDQLRIYDRDTQETAEDLAATRAEHAHVTEAIAAGDAERARADIAGHLARSREVRLAHYAQETIEAAR